MCYVDKPSVWSQPTSLVVNQPANLSCTVSFGGPAMTESDPMFPQLSMSIEPDHPLDLSNAFKKWEPGQPGTQKHRVTVVGIH